MLDQWRIDKTMSIGQEQIQICGSLFTNNSAKPSYLKDTNHVVNKIENIKDETKDSILVAMDVTFITWQKSESGIYIPCKEGINQAAPKIYRC